MTDNGDSLVAALRALEFETVLHEVAVLATCDPGRRAVLALRPRLGEQAWAQAEHALVEDASAFLLAGGSLAFAGAVDSLPLLEQAKKGASLSAIDLRRLGETEGKLREAVRAVDGAGRERSPLKDLARTRHNSDEVISLVERAIDEDGRIVDDASGRLAAIRRQHRELAERLRERCRAMLANVEVAKMLSEPIVTLRSGRYVLPVRAEYVSHFPGVVLDQSASGATVFMEPLASVDASNRLRTLEAEEEREVARILAQLSASVATAEAALAANALLLARLDAIGARAQFALAREAIAPAFVPEPVMRIVQGRHPLLRHKAVPLDFEIGESFDGVVISGPNMGGKTVVLKTVGLLCLLAYAGIPVLASSGTTIGDFSRVACVIGDEQSIAQDLSSFSAHLMALNSAVRGADARTLVLVDEIGTGTEPAAGAALAQAFIETLLRAGSKVVVTTHYTQLKTFAASHDRVRNASMLFDAHTYAPTYVFAPGVPGQSLAFALARALALDAKMIRRAEALMGIEAQNLERTFERLAEDRRRLREQEQALEKQTAQSARAEAALRQRAAALEQERSAFERRAAAELAKAIDDVRARVVEEERKRSELAARQAGKRAVSDERKLAETLAQMRRTLGLEQAEAPGLPAGVFTKGDEVYVRSFDATGTVSDVYDRDVLVTIGNVKTLVPAHDVVHAKGGSRDPKGGSRDPKGGSREFIRAHDPQGSSREFIRAHDPKSGSREFIRAHDPQGSSREFIRAHDKATDIVAAATSLDVRGMRMDEAWPLVDKALDDAALAGLSELRIIHGRGTGRLARGIRDALGEHPQVAAFADAPHDRGGTGVTVVRLR
jgi:DNA mismatch repair protein MutS2